MEYELINLSDPYTFIAEDKETAALAVFLLGTMYGAEPKEGIEGIPVFILGGSEQWYKKEFGRTPEEGLEEKKEKVAKALLSFVLGDYADRKRYEAALSYITDQEKKEAFMKEWQDNRTSLNNIGGEAHTLGKDLIKRIKAKEELRETEEEAAQAAGKVSEEKAE